MLNHFLDNNGSKYQLDAFMMTNECDYARSQRNNQVNEALAAAEVFSENTSQKITFANVTEYGNSDNYSGDWHNAVGKYFSSIRCDLTSNGLPYNAKLYYSINDVYDWNKDITDMGSLPVSQYDMWLLHNAGMAREYEVDGMVEISASWFKGQRIGSGAQLFIGG